MQSQELFAILAPVPLQHLLSATEIAAKEPFVAFGTRKWELLRKVDELRGNSRVPMLIYPSHEEEEAATSLLVCWFGWYIGHVNSIQGAHPQGSRYRPKTTFCYPRDNKGHWAAFWHIEHLRQLPPNKQVSIGKVQGIKGGWRKQAPPRGPELVRMPDILMGET